jgi:aspartate/methionine/tyrosine aminotransferase
VQVPLILKSDAKNAGEFKLDMAALKRAMSPKTRAVILNTPHNPTGKVFSRSELEEIAAVIKTNPRTMVIADEVYEFLVYPDLDSEGKRNEMARMCLVDVLHPS